MSEKFKSSDLVKIERSIVSCKTKEQLRTMREWFDNLFGTEWMSTQPHLSDIVYEASYLFDVYNRKRRELDG